jgi:hypothetical protein
MQNEVGPTLIDIAINLATSSNIKYEIFNTNGNLVVEFKESPRHDFHGEIIHVSNHDSVLNIVEMLEQVVLDRNSKMINARRMTSIYGNPEYTVNTGYDFDSAFLGEEHELDGTLSF